MVTYKKLLLLLLTFFLLSVNYGQNLTVKNRWNIKASYSAYKTFRKDFPFIYIGNVDEMELVWAKKSNIRVELNYGILNCLEVGVYGGFMNYEGYKLYFDDNDSLIDLDFPDFYAPTFGINVNFHILPLFVKNEKCRWELYITAKYGGCYLLHWGEASYGVPLPADDPFADPNLHKYRHEYGVGIGGGVYFWNFFGMYFETSFGQYSYWPDIVSDHFCCRYGIEFKF